MKAPYRLSMSAHDFEFRMDDNENEHVYASYTLSDSQNRSATTVSIDLLNPEFNLKARKPGPGLAPNTPYADIFLYTPTEDDPSGEWRAIFMAVDQHQDATRDHQPNRMLAVNQERFNESIEFIRGNYTGAEWMGVWCKVPRGMKKSTNYIEPKSVLSYVDSKLPDAPETQTNKLKIWSAVNGGFFNVNAPSEIVGHVGDENGWRGNQMS